MEFETPQECRKFLEENGINLLDGIDVVQWNSGGGPGSETRGFDLRDPATGRSVMVCVTKHIATSAVDINLMSNTPLIR